MISKNIHQSRNDDLKPPKRSFLLIMLVMLCCWQAAVAGSISNDYFTLTTPDDSWWLNDDGGALSGVGARAMVYRNDSHQHILELARIDVIDGAFSPQLYLEQQLVRGADPFAHGATGWSEVADTTFAGLPAKRVLFAKEQHGQRYNCLAISCNAGYTTMLVIQAYRSTEANVVGWVVSQLQLKTPATQLTTAAQLVGGAQAMLKKRGRLNTSGNEWLTSIAWSPDSSTVEMSIAIPYTHARDIKAPAFIQVMRERWTRTFPQQARLNTTFAAIVAEQRAIRYTYQDNDGNTIGSLLITPPEYQLLLRREQ